MESVWRYVSPCRAEEEDENRLYDFACDSEWELLLCRLSYLFPDNSESSSDKEIAAAVRRELDLVDDEGNTALHIALDNRAPLPIVRAFLMENPMTPLEDLVADRTVVTADSERVPLASVLNYQGDSALHRATFVSNDPTMIEIIAMAFPAVCSEKNRDSKCPAFYACCVDPPYDALNDDDSTTYAETEDGQSCAGADEDESDQDDEAQIALTKGQQLMAKLNNLGGLPSKEASRPVRLLAPLIKYCPASLSITDSYNCTLLHTGVIDRVDYETLELILDLDPTLTRVQNRFGCTPLQAAARMKAPLPVMKLLLKHFPEAATLVNGMKYLPVTRCIQQRADMEVLEFLLGINPKATLQRTVKGLNGFDLLDKAWDAPRVVEEIMASPVPAAGEEDSRDADKFQNWSKRLLLLLKRLSSDDTKLLHAVIELPATMTAVSYMLWRHPEQLKEEDSEGKLPLHLAAQLGCHHGQTGGDDEETPRLESAIAELVQAHPEAARLPDKSGRLPLHYCLLHRGDSDHEALDALLVAAPESLEIADPVTGLYPFQAAAEHKSLQTIYQFVRALPSLLQHDRRGHKETNRTLHMTS